MAVLTLSIGANAASLSVVYSILLKPLPYPSPSRFIDMEESISGVGPVTPLRNMARIAEYADTLADFNDINLQMAGDAFKIRTTSVTWNPLLVLRTSPIRGRWLCRPKSNSATSVARY
jgi:hypothetical protein